MTTARLFTKDHVSRNRNSVFIIPIVLLLLSTVLQYLSLFLTISVIPSPSQSQSQSQSQSSSPSHEQRRTVHNLNNGDHDDIAINKNNHTLSKTITSARSYSHPNNHSVHQQQHNVSNNNNSSTLTHHNSIPLQSPFPHSVSPFYAHLDPNMSVLSAMSLRPYRRLKLSVLSRDTHRISLFSHPDNPRLTVCRFHHACIPASSYNGTPTVVLRSSYEPHVSSALEKQCSVRVKFDDYIDTNSSTFTRHFDLFGAFPARYHIPHFLTDVIPALYASELIWPTSTHVRRTTNVTCVNPFNNCSTLTTTQAQNIGNIALFSEDRLLRWKISGWVPQFASFMTGHPLLLSEKTMRFGLSSSTSVHGQHVCFNSIVTYPRFIAHMSRTPFWLSERGNAFFRRLNLSRTSPSSTTCTFERRGNITHHPQPYSVYLINRQPQSARHFVQADDIVRALSTALPNVRVTHTSFEESSFHTQMHVMNDADIIVAAHGAALSNVVFSRVDTAVLEVFQFAYVAGPFDALARLARLHRATLIANPDSAGFAKCIMGTGEKGVQAMRKWNASLLTWAKMKRDKEGAIVNGQKEGNSGWIKEIEDLSKPQVDGDVRRCVREQKVQVNIEHVVNIVKRLVRTKEKERRNRRDATACG